MSFDAFAEKSAPLLSSLFDERLPKEALKSFVSLVRSLSAPASDVPAPPVLQVHLLPPGSWALQFQFTLAKPVITKDEPVLLDTDNPIRRERATRIPCVAASSWKGALRGSLRAMVAEDPAKATDSEIEAMLGQEPREDEDPDQDHDEDGGATRGRLQFFISHFGGTGQYVTQSLSRKTKTGSVPVSYETIPERQSAWFTLLYCTYADGCENPEQALIDSRRHLEITAEAVAVMLLETGFGAKKTSGFGIAEDPVAGTLTLRDAPAATFKSLRELDRCHFTEANVAGY